MLTIFVVQNFREIAENPINEIFCDKNFVIATFFVITAAVRRPCGQKFMLSPRPQLHVGRLGVGQTIGARQLQCEENETR